jgi:hypothetical protein
MAGMSGLALRATDATDRFPALSSMNRVALALLVFSSACARKELPDPPPSPQAPARPTQAAARGEAGRPEASRAGSTPEPTTAPTTATTTATTTAPPLAPLAPLANGRRVLIRKLEEDVEAFEILVPPGFKLHFEGNEELAPSAHLVGPDMEIVIEEPESGFYTLAEERDMIVRGDGEATFLRAVETVDGFLIIDRNNFSGVGRRYEVVVSRPNLKVTCVAGGFESASDAERAAAVCLTLRPAPHKAGK